ncbi:amino acid adenylation [Thalassotalea euphylliae]|uniref:amino acid adenylation n=1 Tax=Thalassotalea euphylliae TaxID=1655234 RepID=UPI0015F25E18|nr:amino acid adenylation [Thalassotalea euphylliae]
MRLQFSASNALNKWLEQDLPRLPVPQGKKQAGVNTLTSDQATMRWQVHIIDNQYPSQEKTIIACEANSRFITFIPVPAFSLWLLEDITELLAEKWHLMLATTLESYQLIPRSDIAVLLAALDNIYFDILWVKNTDLSINGHISDAGLWVEQMIREQKVRSLSPAQLAELAIYLNTSVKRATNKTTGRKDRFIPIERLLAYCETITRIKLSHKVEFNAGKSMSDKWDNAKPADPATTDSAITDNVIDLNAFRRSMLGKS